MGTLHLLLTMTCAHLTCGDTASLGLLINKVYAGKRVSRGEVGKVMDGEKREGKREGEEERTRGG